VSSDQRIVAEHGHQIGLDVNKYATWPDIARHVDGKDLILRPWGELFVQRLFNTQVNTYPIIDNLSPETAGARYRAADRGFWGTAEDVAKLLAFNLLETSLKQKVASLGKPQKGEVTWDVGIARAMGASLFLFALSSNDPLRREIEAGGPDAEKIRQQLDVLAKDERALPNEEVQQICDLIAQNHPEHICWNTSLGALGQNLLVSKNKVIAKHLKTRQATYAAMRVFVYGHTHQFEQPWPVDLPGSVLVTVGNTGAFQRLISEKGFLRRAGMKQPEVVLREIKLDELPACYTAVLIDPVKVGAIPVAKVWAWFMPEDGQGMLVAADDQRCKLVATKNQAGRATSFP
jgi:hypothetical protein